MARIAPGTKPWDALMEIVLDGIEGKADLALTELTEKLSAAANLSDLESPADARAALSVYSKAEADLLSQVNGIASIDKIDTVGLVDTYQITLDDATSKTFNVTNGQNGAAGAAGRGIVSIVLQGTAGLVKTYRVTFTDGGTFDYTVTNGTNGSNGTNGTDGAKGDKGDTGPAATYHSTSTTARDIGTGSKQFTVPTMAVPYQLGEVVRVISDANPANYMAGLVTAATATSVTLNVSEYGGAGNFADWTLNIGAFRGLQGPQGSANIYGPAGSVPGPYPDGTVTYEY